MPSFRLPVRELNLGFDVRHRHEYWDDYDFNSAANDKDDIIGQRIRLSFEVVASETVKGFVQIQDARSWGNAAVSPIQGIPVPSPGTGNNTLASQGAATDLHQAYFWALHKKSGLSLQAGRQEWNYGNQKVVGAVGWSSLGRAFDGARVRLDRKWGQTDLLWSRISEGGRNLPAPHVDRHDAEFYGLYGTLKLARGHPFDLYWLALSDDEDSAGETGRVGYTRFHTLGFQLSKNQPVGGLALEYGAELNYQFGKRSGMDHDAYALHGRLGLGSTRWPGQAKLLYQYDVASGDGNRADGDSETFQQLFPTVHLWHGFVDLVARQNVRDHWVALHTVPAKDWRGSVHWHSFKADKGTDALYRATGAVIRVPAPGKSGGTDFGQELDVILDRKVNANWSLQAGFGRFLSGTYLANVLPAGSMAISPRSQRDRAQGGTPGFTPGVPDDDVTFVYLQSTVSF